jgi:ABC-type glycerol-3-phosphate transport system permease component
MKSRVFLSVLILVLLSVSASAQCAMCRATAESGNSNGQHVAGGLNNAILYLMIIPYILLFLFFRKKIWSFLKELRGLWN